MKSYIKFLSRNRLYTAIEAVGLAVSLAFVILSGTYVWQQYSIARQNPDRDRIFLYGSEDFLGMSWCDKDDIDGAIPEAELTTRYMIDQEVPAKVGEANFIVDAAYIDKEFFEMFPAHRCIDGTPAVLDDITNVLISRNFAAKIAAEGKDPVGQTILYEDGERRYVIAGIFEDFGRSIFTNPDIIINVKNSPLSGLAGLGHQVIGNVYTFMCVRPDTDIENLREKCADLMTTAYATAFSNGHKNRLVSLEELYFEPNSYMTRHASRSMLNVLLAVVIALLLSAIFNYINLSSALTSKRAKEMATRRLLGEGKGELFLHNILESIGFTAACLVLALLIAELFEPVMNDLLRGEDTMNPIELSYKPLTLILYALGAVILGALVGLLPSIQSSRYQPIDVIKGTWRRRSKMVFNKVFIVIQNTLSVVLIAIALLMEAQLAHMIDRPLNADTENIFRLQDGVLFGNSKAVEDRLMTLPCVKRIGHSSGAPGHLNMSTMMKDDAGEKVSFRVLFCDTTAFNMLNLRRIDDYNHPLQNSLWLSESFANRAGLCDSTEAKILWRIGNVNMAGSQYIGGSYVDIPAAPASAAEQSGLSAVYVIAGDAQITVNSGLMIETIDESAQTRRAILDCYEKYTEETLGLLMKPHTGDFINASMREGLKPAEDTIRLVEIFMFLAVLLSLLGLVAMSTWYAGQNTKSIAIRKVFGGTVWSETAGSVRGYMVMVLISCALGVPIAVYAGGRYLENFAYRVSGWWWVCLVAVALSLLVSLASVLWQTLRAARTNPAKELKKE